MYNKKLLAGKAFNKKGYIANIIVLGVTISSIALLAVPWIIQMLIQYVILPKEKTFKFWKENVSNEEFPGVICAFLCNAQITLASQMLIFRSNFETEWCTELDS